MQSAADGKHNTKTAGLLANKMYALSKKKKEKKENETGTRFLFGSRELENRKILVVQMLEAKLDMPVA